MDAVKHFLGSYNETVKTTALKVRALVLELMPDAHEVVTGHKNISYSTNAGVMKGGMVYIAPLKDSVNLGFIDGVDLEDRKGLLSGTGKRLRHIKLQSPADVDRLEGDLRDLLQQQRAIKL